MWAERPDVLSQCGPGKPMFLGPAIYVLRPLHLAVIDPRRPFGLIDPMAPPPTGRTPLKAWMVFFYRRNKLAGATPFSQAPEISDSDE